AWRAVCAGQAVQVRVIEREGRPGPVPPEVRQVVADRAGLAVQQLLGQGQLVERLIPELPLGRRVQDPGPDAGQRRGDDQVAGQRRLGRGERLRDPAADV